MRQQNVTVNGKTAELQDLTMSPECRAWIGTGSIHATRTFAAPARIAVQELAPSLVCFIVAHRIDEIARVWKENQQLVTGWSKPFDPRYTRMWPAMHEITIRVDQPAEFTLRWLLPGTPYRRYPTQEQLPANVEDVGRKYISTVATIIREQLAAIPDDSHTAVSLSGGMDSSAVLAVLIHELEQQGHRLPTWCNTLSIDGGGSDVEQALEVLELVRARYPGARLEHTILPVESTKVDRFNLMRHAAVEIEDYRILDLECAMAGILLSDAIRERQNKGTLPQMAYGFDGDGGNEVFLDYPLTDRGHRPIELAEVWENPYLFLLGRPGDQLGTNPVLGSGLSRGYVRTFNVARSYRVKPHSPLLDPRVVDIGARIPMRELAPTEDALHALRGMAIQAGVKTLTGITLPIFPKVKFQDGCGGEQLLRVTEEESQKLKQMLL